MLRTACLTHFQHLKEMTVLVVHAITISFLVIFILKFVSEKEKSCSFVFRLDYKVKPVVISKNLLAIRMSHCRGSSGDCDVGSSLFMFTCHLTPFALESRDIHLHRLVARTTWQPTTFYSSYVCACVDASNLH